MQRILFLIFVFIANYALSANPKPLYSLVKNHYTIDIVNKSFIQSTYVKGIFKDETHTSHIFYSDLETIEGLEASIINNKKAKKVSKNNIHNSDVFTSTFYSGYHSKQILFQKDKNAEFQEFEYKYKIINKELMCLSNIVFYQSTDIINDTIEFYIEIPNSYKLLINKNDLKAEYEIEVDSLVSSTNKTYSFRKVYQKNNFEYNKNKNINKTDEVISIRVLALPKNENEYVYFNNWYQNLINQIPKSDDYKSICDSLNNKYPNKDSLIKNVFKYVNQKIRYIDIENGINAFRPRPSDEVLQKKQGDCKDMALLLYNMLNHLGFEASFALNSTLDNHHQFDFPTISSANHAICILKYNSKTYYLDATEKHAYYDQPSRQIQNTKVFVTKKDHYEIISIPSNEPKFNTVNSNYFITVNDNSISGEFSNEYYGYSKLEIDNIISNYSLKTANQILKKYFQDHNYNIKYSSINFNQNNENTKVKGAIELSSSVLTNLDDRRFFNFNFCPSILPTSGLIDTTRNNDYPTYSSNLINTKVIIQFPNAINRVESLYENFSIKKEGIEYKFKVRKEKNNLIIEYTYINPHVIIKKEQIKNYNNLSIEILKTLNHEIIIY